MVKKVIFWLPTLLWMALIFYLSSQPNLHASQNAAADFTIKKFSHFSEYFILALFIHHSLKHTTHLRGRKLLVYTLVFTMVYALTDEFHQTLVPGRSPSIRDVAIDSLGSIFGTLFLRLW